MKWIPILLLIYWGCAAPVTPTGGEKDVKPPQVVIEEPPNQTINLNVPRITITFDEFINLFDPVNQIVISPPMKEFPVLRTNRNKLHIVLPDSLEKNTTYTIQFSEAIRDLNENNILIGYQYVFSTGSEIDTLKYEGVILEANSGLPAADLLVAMHRGTDRSKVLTEKPWYLTRSQENGKFIFNNLHEGVYLLTALEDKNRNYQPDRGEKFGFLPTELNLPSDLTTDTIFVYEITTPSIKNAWSSAGGKLTLSFGGESTADSIRIHPPPQFTQLNPARDTGNYWFISTTDSITISFMGVNGMQFRKVLLKSIDSDQRFIPGAIDSLQNPFNPVAINLPVPFKSMDVSHITLREDSVTISPTITQDSINNRLMVDYPWKENKDYTLIFQNNSLVNIYNIGNDSVAVKWRTLSYGEYGQLSLKIDLSQREFSYILALRQGKSRSLPLQRLLKPGMVHNLELNGILPGNYTIVLIEDRNNNQRWDGGDFRKNILPERTITYSQPVVVKPNWELELEIQP